MHFITVMLHMAVSLFRELRLWPSSIELALR